MRKTFNSQGTASEIVGLDLLVDEDQELVKSLMKEKDRALDAAMAKGISSTAGAQYV